MNIAFITCFYKTILFKHLADNLSDLGYNIYWISTSQKWTKWLISNGIDEQNVMLLRRDLADDFLDERQCINIIDAFERETGENIKRLFYMDRVVSKWDWPGAMKYISYLIFYLGSFIEENSIKVVFGEATAIHEVLLAIICKQKNSHYLCPHTLRIPSNKFAFFKGYQQKEFQLIRENISEYKKINEAISVIRAVVDEGVRPNYWHWSNSKPKYDLSMVLTALRKILEATFEAKTDATVKPISYHFKYEKKYLKPLRSFLSNIMTVFENPREEKYVLYTLHKQPEASLDVLGVKYQNQIELIKQIAISLPQNLKLYVKEHSNCIGERSIAELKKIKKIPGVKLINPFSDIHKLIKGSKLVVTVSGTVAFEAGLHNIPAVTLSDMFFNKLTRVKYLNNVDDISHWILNDYKITNLNNKDLGCIAHMLSNSFDGVISDPKSAPLCVSKSNIEAVTKGFVEVLDCLSRDDGELL